jgi:uncharacterized protein (DUF433 family)
MDENRTTNGNGHQSTIVRTSRGLSIAGTRITLYQIMDCVVDGWPPKLIRDRFDLTDQQIADVMAYLADHRAEVEAEYQQVLRDSEEVRRYWEDRNLDRFARIAALPHDPDQAAIRAKLAAYRAQWRQS